MKLISRSQSAFQGQNNTIINEGDTFYIDGDTPEKDLSQRGREFLGSLRSGKQFLYPDTPEAEEFLKKLAEKKKLEVKKSEAKARDERSNKKAAKEWYEKPRGLIGIGIFIAVMGGIVGFVICEYLTHIFPHFFHSTKP